MLRFKQFISVYLTEATIKHFAHLGLDPDNQEHNDLVDAYNLGHSKNDPNVPRNPNQIKSLEHLNSVAAPHYKEILQKRKEKQDDEKAFKNKEAELVHHDPNTGLKVFKVRSGRGCAAAADGATGCVYDRTEGHAAFQKYDPTGEHSYVIHTPEKGNLSRVSIIGVKPGRKHRTGAGGNFQDKGNVTIEDSDWVKLRNKYNLDSIKALEGIRGIPISKETLEKRKKLSNDLIEKLKQSPLDGLDHLSHAIDNNYLNTEHVNIAGNIIGHHALRHIAEKSDDPEILNAALHHPKNTDSSLSAIVQHIPSLNRDILNHPNIGIKTLSKLLDKGNYTFDEKELHNVIMNHPQVDHVHLYNIAQKTYNPETQIELLKHPLTHSATVSEIAKRAHYPEVHQELLKHKNINSYDIDNIAENSFDQETHKAILSHLETQSEALEHVAQNSDDPEILNSIKNHPKFNFITDKDILKKIWGW